MVFEVFDNHPENNRSLFGGGRYNGLADIFGSQNIPAVGFAPGDITTKLFLEQNDLFPKDQIHKHSSPSKPSSYPKSNPQQNRESLQFHR